MGLELPPRCTENCPLNEVDVAEHPVVIGRNCSGPVAALEGDTVTSRVELHRDGSAYEEVCEVPTTARYVCRNLVFLHSVNKLVAETKEREAL